MPYVYAFSVLVDENGEITERYENGADMEDEVLASAVGLVMDSDAQSGTLRSFALIYMKKNIPNGTVIAFASLEPLKITMKNTILISVAACLASLLIFLYVSNVLAGFAIKPIAAAWQQQKQFVADASHDLKTPLTVILANTGILMSHKEQTLESQLKWIESTEEEAQYMRGLVDRMLELAKSEDMGTTAMLSDLDISELSHGYGAGNARKRYRAGRPYQSGDGILCPSYPYLDRQRDQIQSRRRTCHRAPFRG